jgi:hypothetical protein
MLDVTNLFPHEVTNKRRVNLPDQVRRENKASVQRHDHVQPPPPVLSRKLSA